MDSGELPKLTKSSKLDTASGSDNLFKEFFQSAVYAGLESPLRAGAQLVDHFSDHKSEPGAYDRYVQNGFKTIAGVSAPQTREFGSSQWYAQQLGGAAGMILPFLALRAGLKTGAERAFANSAFVHNPQTLLQFAAREAALSGTTGFVYGAVLSPSAEANLGSSKFYTDRIKTGLADSATFATLGFTGPYFAKGFHSIAGLVESSSLPLSVSSKLAESLKIPVLAGVASGVPAGFVSAEANAMKDLRFATGNEVKESIVGLSFVGGVFAGLSRFVERPELSNSKVSGSVVEIRERTLTPADKHIGAMPADLHAALEQAAKRIKIIDPVESQMNPGINVFQRLENIRVNEIAAKDKTATQSSDNLSNAIKDNTRGAESKLPGLDIVLGASGIEAPAHVGFLKALEAKDVPVAHITGVSGGALVAALYANKYSPTEIKNILLSDSFRYPRPEVLAKCCHLTDPWNLYPYSIDFRPWLQDFVDTYKLKPQENLKIVAADKNTRAPVVFEGTKYDLVEALTASTAATLGLNMKPVNHQGRQLIDGFYYHPTPADLSKAPAVVSKIGFVSKLPTEVLSPWDYFMHIREMSYYNKFKNKYPDPKGHIIAETGLPDVATTTFGVSKETLLKLIDHAYESTTQRLQQPDALKAIKEAQTERNLR